MFKFLTSLSFLYAFVIGVLIIFGWIYYRNFMRSGYQRRIFPWIFLLIGAACLGFLYVNFHSPLSFRSFSNLDHQFIKHEGFSVRKNIEFGRSDTAFYPDRSFSRFRLEKENGTLYVNAGYSEEPFYTGSAGQVRLVSKHFPAPGHHIAWESDTIKVRLSTHPANEFRLSINKDVIVVSKELKKGITGWELFKDDISFINSPWYTDEKLLNGLKQVMVLVDPSQGGASLVYFISGRFFRYGSHLSYDGRAVASQDLAFKGEIADGHILAWGLGFPGNNKNQYRVQYLDAGGFFLKNRYPVMYPLLEENKEDWSKHTVTKFLVSDNRHLVDMPAVFNEGFLFAAADGDSSLDFYPALLNYRKDAAGKPLQLQVGSIVAGKQAAITVNGTRFILPARSDNFSWDFSVYDSFTWNFGNREFSPGLWKGLIFGCLLFFIALVFFATWLKRADKLSWIWQLLACVTLVLITTRFFLYWRYKSFPPFEGLDLPSQQQLNSIWNFGIIGIVCIGLALLFGFGVFKFIFRVSRKLFYRILNKRYEPVYENDDEWDNGKLVNRFPGSIVARKTGFKTFFFAGWTALLCISGALAFISNFDASVTRHLSIGLMLAYFLFVYISYKHSPLVAATEKSWWSLRTGSLLNILFNNPVKIILSLSLLGVFVFVDIGFAIIFLNFLLFNEAFLCINYAIAGLSAGSRKNAGLFGIFGGFYLGVFILNLIYAPYIFKTMLESSRFFYMIGYGLFAVLIAHTVTRLMVTQQARKKWLTGFFTASILFLLAFFFFPRQRILDKAAMTRYRIDVMTMPVEKAIETAYDEGKTWEPVIRAAQNQWFINTFIHEENNPAVNKVGFRLLPHSPQHKGARYNAQATDLVTSRFLIAEHGKWSVLLYVLLLLVPATLLASFYKLYPDFTNRINIHYPTITAGFSMLNYLLITALLVILAATGRYIFFGQDLPFGSILSKQSILFPALLITAIVILFKHIPIERYPNRKKMIPGALLFASLGLLLLFVKPVYNKSKEFEVAGLSREMDPFIQLRLQPILDHFDTSRATRRLPVARKDRLFSDSVKQLIADKGLEGSGKFFYKEIVAYAQTGFARHLDQRKLLYLDLHSGRPQLAINDNYFRVEAPPHLQQAWTGSLFGDTTNYIVTLWDAKNRRLERRRISSYAFERSHAFPGELELVFSQSKNTTFHDQLAMVNRSPVERQVKQNGIPWAFKPGDTILLGNPSRFSIINKDGDDEKLLTVEPDAFMKNYYVNGSRYYVYPLSERFIWARHFSESIAAEYTAAERSRDHAFVSLDYELTDSISARIRNMMSRDTAYKKGAEYAISIADGNGRIIAMSDHIKELDRPDPNDKPGFNKTIRGENGWVSQSLLRKKIGNINLLRLNPGPGSTLKPIVFSAIASQLYMDWDAFAAEGFSEKQQYYGGEKVAEYDFEKNNGRISNVVDYLRYSDNYYHSNILLIGSYPRQSLKQLLSRHFAGQNPEQKLHWPYFTYANKQYWLDGYENWPGYLEGKTYFGTDSSFISTGLASNFNINTQQSGRRFDLFESRYDSALLMNAYRKSSFILPETALFDQQGPGVDHRKPNEVFMACFRGHVKGSSQVLVPPVKMLEAFGKLVTQNRDYSLTLDPYAKPREFNAFSMDQTVAYSSYLSIMKENVFEGMKQALFSGTAARLGTMLKNGAPYYYYAKTGTTGDDEVKSKSKLFTIVISEKDISDPDFNFRKNRFYTIYFTSQNGPPKQNEEFQKEIIQLVQRSGVFNKYMNLK